MRRSLKIQKVVLRLNVNFLVRETQSNKKWGGCLNGTSHILGLFHIYNVFHIYVLKLV